MKELYAIDLWRVQSGTQVDFYGWVKTRRRHLNVIFLDVCDSTGSMQVIVDPVRVGKEVFGTAKRITSESAVRVRGIVTDVAKRQSSREIHADYIELVGAATLDISPRPRSNLDIFDPKLQEQLLSKRYLYLRNEKISAILRYRHVLMGIVHQWFRQHGFVEIHAPILTPTPLYDDRTAIPLDVEGQHVYLTQCVGFYLEQAVHAFEKVYSIGPSFRAEESRSKRHLMEYWHIKAELAFVDFEEIAATVEAFIHDITRESVIEGAELAKLIGTEICQDGLKIPFPRIDYCEAVGWLQTQRCKIEVGESLNSEEEALLGNRFGATPFWIVGIPRSIEPFPYVIDPSDPRLTKTADLIASQGFGEILGIAEKIDNLAMLDERLAEKGKIDDPRYEWLRELRQYGCVPHGGFGMGIERLIRWLLRIPHVRDAIPFHRTFGRRIHP